MQEGYQLLLDEMMGQMFLGGLRSRSNRQDDSDQEDSDENPGPGPAATDAAQPDADSYRPLLNQLRDAAVPVPTKVATLHRILATLRAARQAPKGLIAAGGVLLLCNLVTRDWPAGGDLAASRAEVDVVAVVRPPAAGTAGSAGRRGGGGGGGGSAASNSEPLSRLPHHSMRRLAAAALAELSRWPAAVTAMHSAQLFTLLPPILADLALRYRYGQSYRRMYGTGRRTDQAQYILERLMAVCAEAASSSDLVRRACSGPLLDAVVRGYPRMDVRQASVTARMRLRPRPVDDFHPTGPGAVRPPMAWDSSESSGSGSDSGEGDEGDDEMEMGDGEDEAAAAAAAKGQAVADPWRSGGGVVRRWRRAVNARAGAEVPQLEAADSAAPRGGGRRAAAADFMAGLAGGGGGGPGEWDPMPTAFLKLLAAVWYGLPPASQQRLIEEGVLAALTAFPVAGDMRHMDHMLSHTMRMTYNSMALSKFAAVRSADESLRERACQLRLRGNEAFKAGRYEAALALYTDAVALDWDEPTHRNNRVFALTKLGRLMEARVEGQHSIACDPRNPRSWSRLATVQEALKHSQAAQLCYRQAIALTRPRRDEELERRLAEVEQQLQGAPAWRFETVPVRTFLDRDGRWRNWIARSLPKAQVRALEMMVQLSGMSVEAGGLDLSSAAQLSSNPALTAAMASEPYLASTMLKPLWEMACAIEEVSHTPFEPMLQFNVSWSDTGLRDRSTGIPFFTLSCMDAREGLQRGPSRLYLGKPRFLQLRNALCVAIARPLAGKPGRPSAVFVAHRAVPYFDKLKAFFGPLGIEMLCESQHEANQSAANYNTDPSGFNHRDHYRDEVRDEYAQDPSAAGPSGAGAGGAGFVKSDVASDDDATAEYQVMLAEAATGARGSGAGAGGGGSSSGRRGGAATAALPSEAEVRAATAELLDVSDVQTTTVKHLLTALREKFGCDVSGMKQIVRGVAVQYVQQRQA